ncbi:MAG: hypothetical protein JSR26_03985 [Proteobacteria bacterium]|nr:hypothetical protein [Pseudomonadota bacterium]
MSAPEPSPAPAADAEPKWFAQSKTVLLAALVAVAGLGDVIDPYTAQLRALLGPAWFGWLMLALGIASAIVRHHTAAGLSLKPPAKPEP